jgi:pyrroline-5-carboxylate reductase
MTISNIIGAVNVGIIGMGKMGEAIAKGLLKSKKYRIFFNEINQQRADEVSGKVAQVKYLPLEQLIDTSQIIILAVKPQDLPGLLEKVNEILKKEKLFVSICAGISTSYLSQRLTKARIIRIMPNMGALVGNSYSAITPGKKATPNDVKLVKEMFSTIGKVEVVSEDLMDAVTALSGSGPGYLAYFLNALIEAGKEIGLGEASVDMVLSCLISTAKIVEELKIMPEQLVSMVASKGGTTEACLGLWSQKDFEQLVKDGVKKALQRAKELEK